MDRREWTPASTQHVSDLHAGAGRASQRAEELASFAVEHVNDTAVLRVSGEIDMLSTPRLRDELGTLIEGGSAVVVLDLAAVSFFASSGLAALVEARDGAAATGVRLRLAGLSRSVHRPLQITGLSSRFEIYQDVQTALLD